MPETGAIEVRLLLALLLGTAAGTAAAVILSARDELDAARAPGDAPGSS